MTHSPVVKGPKEREKGHVPVKTKLGNSVYKCQLLQVGAQNGTILDPQSKGWRLFWLSHKQLGNKNHFSQ